MEKPVFKLHPSRLLKIAIAVLLTINVLFIVLISLNIDVKVAIVMALLTYTAWIMKQCSSVRELIPAGKGQWRVHDRKGERIGEICGDSILTTWLCVVRLRIDGVRWPRSYVVFRDALSPAQYRRLMVAMRG